MNSDTFIQDARLGSNDMRVYEFGARLDPECVAAADEQIRKARLAYNEIIACLRSVYDEMQAWVMDRAGPEAKELRGTVVALSDRFEAARAANDEAGMRESAAQRREEWRALSSVLAGVRKAHAAEIRTLFYSRVGSGGKHETYQIRCSAVAAGLGWATANDVLDRALTAWKDSMRVGRAPVFARGDDKTQDCLVLQFTAAGGVDVNRICDGSHSECRIKLPQRLAPKQYGSFRFRLGSGATATEATGSVQVHRELPPSSAVGARLVRRKHANKWKWALQLVLRLAEPVTRKAAPTRTLVCVHMGWAAADDGRVVAGIADAADPGLARVMKLPESIESDLRRAADIQAERDVNRDAAVPALKELARRTDLVPHLHAPAEADGSPDSLAKELEALSRLPAQHIAAKRFYVLQRLLLKQGVCVEWLSKWVANDRKQWQATVGVARRARERRRHFYREEALKLARGYSAILLETLDLKAAAIKVDESSGERSEFGKKARAGRVVASLYEFEQELRKAAGDFDRAFFEMEGATTIRCCAMCGSKEVGASSADWQTLVCGACGAISDRKSHGAAVAWQLASEGIEDRILDFHARQAEERRESVAKTAERKRRMAAGRRAGRSARAEATSGDGDSALVV